MKNWNIFTSCSPLKLPGAACAPKRYERKYSPVGASSVKNHLTKLKKKSKQKKQSDEHDKEAIGTFVKADPAISTRSLKTVRLDLFTSGATDSFAGVEQ